MTNVNKETQEKGKKVKSAITSDGMGWSQRFSLNVHQVISSRLPFFIFLFLVLC